MTSHCSPDKKHSGQNYYSKIPLPIFLTCFLKLTFNKFMPAVYGIKESKMLQKKKIYIYIYIYIYISIYIYLSTTQLTASRYTGIQHIKLQLFMNYVFCC